jgi:YVTN family beta-propeller protein
MIDNDILGMRVNSGAPQLKPGFGTAGYVVDQMNICMALSRNPVSGALVMVGTDATNEIRFEPNVRGRFIRVLVSIVNGTTGSPIALVDMNEEHLEAAQAGPGTAYQDGDVPQADRNKSIGDPRGIAFDPSGARLYVTGMGSNNVIVLDASTGQRLGGVGHAIDVGAGPTGIVHHPSLGRLYILNKFDASISVVNSASVGSESVVQTLAFYDPTPDFINTGRAHFYNTHLNSGLGHIACASCHIDGAMDRLAWDLGDPLGNIKPTQLVNLANPGPGQQNLSFTTPDTFDDFHFMKGPMTTQTLQDIIGHEPHHWRGDRDGIEEFAGAFAGLQGRDAPLDAGSMQEFEDFLSTIHFMPNPFRAIDNSLPGGPKFVGAGMNPTLPLPGHFTSGRFAPEGNPLPNGNAWRGFQLYVDGDPSSIPRPADPEGPPLDSPFQCASCHSLPMGSGSIDFFNLNTFTFQNIAPGPNGEAHLAMVSVDGTGEHAFKTPQLRNQLDKEGLYMGPDPSQGGQARMSRAGFGVLHDGSIEGIEVFLSSLVFDMRSDQDVADVAAFVLTINGDDFAELLTLPGAPTGAPAGIPNVRDPGPDGGETQTAHAAVGRQVTLNSQSPSQNDLDLINVLIELADNGIIDLVVKGVEAGHARGWYRVSGAKADEFQSDQNGVAHTTAFLLGLADPGAEITFMAAPAGSGERLGVDRDEDTYYDFTEFLNGTDPADPNSFAPPPQNLAMRPSWTLALAACVLAAGLLLLRRKPKRA